MQMIFVIVLDLQGQGSRVQPMHVVVSLGTGKMPVQEVKYADVYRPEGLFDIAKVAFGARELAELMIDQVRDAHWVGAVDRSSLWKKINLETKIDKKRNSFDRF